MERLIRLRLVEKGGQEFSVRMPRALRRSIPGESSAGALEKGKESARCSMARSPLAEADRILLDIGSRHLQSYKELPQLWFYFGFEPSHPSEDYVVRAFSLRIGEIGEVSLRDPAWAALSRVMEECGLESVVSQAALEPERESTAQEHSVISEEGSASVGLCRCGYTANLECAVSRVIETEPTPPPQEAPELVETPDKRTIAAVSEFLSVPPASVIKSLLYIVAGKPVLVLVRGDDQVNECLLCQALATSDARAAEPNEVEATFGAEPGSIGPVGKTGVRILADHGIRSCSNMVCGANQDGYHLIGVEPERDFRAEYFFLRQICEGDACPNCGQPLFIKQAYGLMRSSASRAADGESAILRVLGADNKTLPVSVSVHTFHLDTFLVALVGHFCDADGIVLPRAVAPFDAIITPVSYRDDSQKAVCDRLYEALTKQGVDVLLDDRDVSPGVKFKDADLIGVPLRITVGPKKVKEGKVELRSRRTGDSLDCGVEEVVCPILRGVVG